MKLKETKFGREGQTYCKFADTEIEVLIPDEEVTSAYIDQCMESLDSFSNELLETLCEAAKKYCLKMKAVCAEEEEENEDIAAIPVTADTPASEMMQYIQITSMKITEPDEEDVIAYQLSGNCDWNVENGIEIILVDDQIVYVGPFEDHSPWDDETDDADEWNFIEA